MTRNRSFISTFPPNEAQKKRGLISFKVDLLSWKSKSDPMMTGHLGPSFGSPCWFGFHPVCSHKQRILRYMDCPTTQQPYSRPSVQFTISYLFWNWSYGSAFSQSGDIVFTNPVKHGTQSREFPLQANEGGHLIPAQKRHSCIGNLR